MAPAMPDPGALRAWVDFAIHERHPDDAAAVVVAAGLRNWPSDADSERRLAAAEAGLRARGLTRAAEDAHLAAWRQAFSAFGAKLSKRRSRPACSRASRCRASTASSTCTTPSASGTCCPSAARTAIDSTVRCASSSPSDEPFDPRGDGAAVEYAVRGEIIWRDDRGVTCRVELHAGRGIVGDHYFDGTGTFSASESTASN